MLVLAGVSGSGKSDAGRLLADRLGWPFAEGDDLHPPANVARMRAGVPLDDADRAPWLDRVAGWIAERLAGGQSGVVSCSALKRSYRDRLRAAGGGIRFVLLDPPPQVLRARLAARRGHFMPPKLLASQLAALERPRADEDMLVITEETDVAGTCDRIAAWLAHPPPARALTPG